MTEAQNRILKLVMVGILMFSMFVVAREGAVYVNSLQVENEKKVCIVIDAGHGGGNLRKLFKHAVLHHKKYSLFV